MKIAKGFWKQQESSAQCVKLYNEEQRCETCMTFYKLGLKEVLGEKRSEPASSSDWTSKGIDSSIGEDELLKKNT